MRMCKYGEDEGKITCMMAAVRDGYCIPHWRFVLGHKETTEGLGEDAGQTVPSYCSHCQRLLNFDGWQDDPCPGRGAGAHGAAAVVYGHDGVAQLLQGFGIPVVGLDDPDAAQAFLFMLMDMTPECPNCHTHRCADWMYRHLFWVMNTIMDRERGVLSMFLALLKREGWRMDFDPEELLRARQEAQYLKRSLDPATGHVHVQVELTPPEGAEGQEGGGDEEWPDLINEGGVM